MFIKRKTVEKHKPSTVIQNTKLTPEELVIEAKLALQKKQKTNRDIELIEEFMSQLLFVQRLKSQHGPLIVTDFCKNLAYLRVPAHTEIITINKESKTFFVILSGKVSISIYMHKAQSFIQYSREKRQSLRKSISSEEDLFFKLQEIKYLQQGESFGELSLLKENSKATATIITKVESEFAILTRKQYHEILGKISQTEHIDKHRFLQTIPLFQGWNDEDLRQLSYYLIQRAYTSNQWVMREGAENSQLFLIRQGTFTLVKKNRKRNMTLSLLHQSEIYMQTPEDQRYDFSIICTSTNASLYELAQYDFNKYLQHNNIEQFREYALQRQQWRQKRVLELNLLENNEEDDEYETSSCLKTLNSIIDSDRDEQEKRSTSRNISLKDQMRKTAQRALKKKLLPRFSPIEDGLTLPAIRKTSAHEKIQIDLIDADRSFETVKGYKIGQAEAYNLYQLQKVSKHTNRFLQI